MAERTLVGSLEEKVSETIERTEQPGLARANSLAGLASGVAVGSAGGK